MNGPDVQRAATEQRAQVLVETIREIGIAGSLRNIAAALNERGAGGRLKFTSAGQVDEKPLICAVSIG